MSEPEVTIKNTKTEIMDALNSALKRAEIAEQGRLNPEKDELAKIEKKFVESAKNAVEQNIFSKELTDKLPTTLRSGYSLLQNNLKLFCPESALP
ncbi:MAG: hypothetical protein FWE97_03610 [Dehalococcoidia bacterium]|nr:hypothetical protein [Dehalococcoidia bacterium]